MPRIPVHLAFLTGLRRPIFRNVRLVGSWDVEGRYSNNWTTVPMEPFTDQDGCPSWRTTVEIEDSQMGWTFHWGVVLDNPSYANIWGIPTEVNHPQMRNRHRDFKLEWSGQTENYYLTHCRRLGANKYWPDGRRYPAIRFSVWAPNARNVELVIGDPATGYIYNDSRGVVAVYPMERDAASIWHTNLLRSPDLDRFESWDHRPYMYRITKDDGSVALRTDLFSRCQIGRGRRNPEGTDGQWNGTRHDLDGCKGCSVVIDPEQVTRLFQERDVGGQPIWPETQWLSEEEFWRDEFDSLRPMPTRMEDLVIYELHVGGLGFGRPDPGTLEDAIGLLDQLVDLGVNAIELMPMAEFEGWAQWGYGNSHYMAIEYSAGGRDQFKHFVRECHRRGIAVLLDVVYNHYTRDAERAEWMYDSNAHERNIYYWYEGLPSDYPNPVDGYLPNNSTGDDPAFWSEMVRKLFISSAAMLVAEFHVDGFRVDLTDAIHANPRVETARMFGGKFLREWTRTMKLIKPNVFLIAEDHSIWQAVTQPTDADGLGFDARWYSQYYHHLIGDGHRGPEDARLIWVAGHGGDQGLAMNYFEGALRAAAHQRVIYHESHDEAGNSGGSGRTIAVTVDWAPLIDETRRYAEARCRVASGITLTAPGIPLFFMGEEIGAAKPYRYNDFMDNREDLMGDRNGVGRNLFRFYQEAIRLRRSQAALRSHDIDIVHVHNDNRVIAFLRRDGDAQLLVLASLNNRDFDRGYRIDHPLLGGSQWQEIFNSDNPLYGGRGLLNSEPMSAAAGSLSALLAANSICVFERR